MGNTAENENKAADTSESGEVNNTTEAQSIEAEKISSDEVVEAPEDGNKKPKKKKALKIVLIVFALLIAAIVATGAFVVKRLSNLGNVSSNHAMNPDVSDSAVDPEGNISVSDTDISDGTSGEDESGASVSETVTAAPGEEPATIAEESGTSETTGEDGPLPTQASSSTADASQTTSRTSQTTTPTSPSGHTSPTTPVKPENPVPTTAPQPSDQPSHSEAQPSTAAPQPISVSEYDIYRSGTFHVKGTVTDENNENAPMELAVCGDSIYMLSEFEGASIGILKNGKKAYMIYPDKKAYMELNSLVMSMLGEDIDSLMDPSVLGFNKLQPLNKALRTSEVTVKGIKCVKYVFKNTGDNDYTNVYIKGNRMVRIESADSSGKITSTIDYSYVSDKVPEDRKKPSADYEKMGMISFISLLSDNIALE